MRWFSMPVVCVVVDRYAAAAALLLAGPPLGCALLSDGFMCNYYIAHHAIILECGRDWLPFSVCRSDGSTPLFRAEFAAI